MFARGFGTRYEPGVSALDMFERFSHFLSYGATDQLTVRELVDSFDGLVVPGTVAAFQREGTGGFVLTLSATAARPQYVIDSRFPLFQRRLPNPKRAHRALAELLGVPALVSEAKEPDPAQFSDQMIARIAENWVSFNQGYSTNTIGKFDKYAKRLQEAVELPDVQQPAYVLPPYLVAAGMTDPWWEVSRRLFLACVALDPGPPCVPVAAATDPEALQSIVGNLVDTDRLVVWVSNLPELETDANTLRLYAETLSPCMGDSSASCFRHLASWVPPTGLAMASTGLGLNCHNLVLHRPATICPLSTDTSLRNLRISCGWGIVNLSNAIAVSVMVSLQ
jgi:hypothetical protein